MRHGSSFVMSSGARRTASRPALRPAGGGQIRRQDLVQRRVVLGAQVHLVGPAVEPEPPGGGHFDPPLGQVVQIADPDQRHR